jgi:soluble lytic murein transglycosylase
MIAWFGGRDPQTAEGAMALAAAYQAAGPHQRRQPT